MPPVLLVMLFGRFESSWPETGVQRMLRQSDFHPSVRCLLHTRDSDTIRLLVFFGDD